jgi:outer membrane protein assembly factor BamA
MKIKLYLALVFYGFFGQSQNLSDKIFFGGGAGFSLSSNQTNITVTPMIGYKITQRLMSGVSGTYQYVKIKQPSRTVNNYGGSLFSIYQLNSFLFAQAEYERLSFEYFTDPFFEQRTRSTYNSMLVGLGTFSSLGGRSSFWLTAMYNLLYDSNEPGPYNSPWVIRAGVGVGIF